MLHVISRVLCRCYACLGNVVNVDLHFSPRQARANCRPLQVWTLVIRLGSGNWSPLSMLRYFVMSSHTPEGGASAGAAAPTGMENSPPLDERAEVRDLLPDSPAGAFIATSADIPLQGDAHEHVERTPPQTEGGGVPPSQFCPNWHLNNVDERPYFTPLQNIYIS
jgi:hypothetical protein